MMQSKPLNTTISSVMQQQTEMNRRAAEKAKQSRKKKTEK